MDITRTHGDPVILIVSLYDSYGQNSMSVILVPMNIHDTYESTLSLNRRTHTNLSLRTIISIILPPPSYDLFYVV